MPVERCRRMLLIAAQKQRAELGALVDRDRWELAEADDLQQARFVLQMQTCDAVVYGGFAGIGWTERLVWLNEEAPMILVGELTQEVVEALGQGAVWLPVDAVHSHPGLLAAGLDQALARGKERRQAAAERSALRECEARINRLLSLLWEAAPGEGLARWFTQRHMLERLDEEVERTRRHGGPLSVILGELQPEHGERLKPEQAQRLSNWMAGQIKTSKRRCDVAGQYGLHGFMLVLPQASGDEAGGACRRLRELLANPPHPDLPCVQPSFGLASVPEEQPSTQELLCRAEERLEVAREGRFA